MKLNSRLDITTLARDFRQYPKMHIRSILDDYDAKALYKEITAPQRWNFVFQVNGRHYDLDPEGWRNMAVEDQLKTQQIVHAHASEGFTYIHYLLPIYDRYHGGGDLTPGLKQFFEFLNGEEFLNFMRTLTGAHDIAYADAQLTRLGPGHFITIHNDDIEGKNRRAAYVLNMTPEWQEDWGGYLNFYDDIGNIEAGFKPAFNALNVFTVPARHSVSVVAPFAQQSRYVISGWLRAGENPAVNRA